MRRSAVWRYSATRNGRTPMACSEFTQAIQWLQSGSGSEMHPVRVFFSKHYGYAAAYTAHRDSVTYAVGEVGLAQQPTPHLKGTLPCYTNGALGDGMSFNSHVTVDIEIFDDGTLSYLMKYDGQVPFDVPPIAVMATCV